MAMPRIGLMAVFVFVMAQGMCYEDCDVGDCDSTNYDATSFLQPGAPLTRVSTRDDCTTCSHSNVVVKGTFRATESGKNVTVRVSYQCLPNGPTGVYNFPKTAPVVEGPFQVNFDDIGVKNVCGENARVAFDIGVDNPTNAELQLQVGLFCPTKIKDNKSPTGPPPAN